jgi:hypothetical protein
MKIKKGLFIVLQFILLFIFTLPVISTKMVTETSDCVKEYTHDIWYHITLISIGFIFYVYFKYAVNKWYKLEDFIIFRWVDMEDFILTVQKWRNRIFAISFIIMIIYVIFFT